MASTTSREIAWPALVVYFESNLGIYQKDLSQAVAVVYYFLKFQYTDKSDEKSKQWLLIYGQFFLGHCQSLPV